MYAIWVTKNLTGLLTRQAGTTALIWAAKEGNLNVVVKLAQQDDVDIDAADDVSAFFVASVVSACSYISFIHSFIQSFNHSFNDSFIQ